MRKSLEESVNNQEKGLEERINDLIRQAESTQRKNIGPSKGGSCKIVWEGGSERHWSEGQTVFFTIYARSDNAIDAVTEETIQEDDPDFWTDEMGDAIETTIQDANAFAEEIMNQGVDCKVVVRGNAEDAIDRYRSKKMEKRNAASK